MNNKVNIKAIILSAMIGLAAYQAQAAQSNSADEASHVEVYQLSYIEREPGVDDYEVNMLVSERFIRVDEVGEESGFIIYDDKLKKIFSVSHFDKSVLVINQHVFSEDDSPVKHEVEYLELADAPSVSGRAIYNYRVFTGSKENEETCAELQIVEGLLPEVSSMLRNYQKVVSGQQVKMTNNIVDDIQTPCFYVDQIYNTGAYYDKGLPIQEWHSNERSKMLTTYKKVKVDPARFSYPEDYRKFSVDDSTRMSLD